MTRRWQADGIPFWRKLFSSNWWWYGEVNPDPASLPPLEKRPKFWRGDVIAMLSMLIAVPGVLDIAAELNGRYWSFNRTTTYVGRIVATTYQYPQLEVELTDKTIVQMALPMPDLFGFTNRAVPIYRWTPVVDELMLRQQECPSQLLAFDAQQWRFSFKPLLNVWEVRCAYGDMVVSQDRIDSVASSHAAYARLRIYGFLGFTLFFSIVLIIRRERKLYVKS